MLFYLIIGFDEYLLIDEMKLAEQIKQVEIFI